MTCREIIAGASLYRYCPDPVPATDADRVRALLWGTFFDELNELPLDARLQLSTTTGLTPRSTHGAIGGLVGSLRQANGGTSAEIDLTVRAERYVSRRFVTASASLPVELGRVPMHRAGVVIAGRVVSDDGSERVPLSGAVIAVAAVWRAFPAANVDPLAVREDPNLVALSPGLYADRPSAAAVQRRNLALAAEVKHLVRPAAAGASHVVVSDSLALAPNDVLALDPAVPDRAEYVLIDAIECAATPDQPARVRLRHALIHEHERGAAAVRAVLDPPGAANQLVRGGIRGDAVLHLDDLADLDEGAVVEITSGGDTEFQTIRRYRTETDARGFYRLPVLSRVAQLELVTTHADFADPVTLRISPDYDRANNHQDIIFV
jgi:hypothetical protein